MFGKIVFWVLVAIVVGGVGGAWALWAQSAAESRDVGLLIGLLGSIIWGWVAGNVAFAIYSNIFDN